jgi:RNA polymerase sigma-70 factor, ECF subfamily
MRREIVEAARRGDRRAFETLVTSVVDRLYAAAVFILHDRTLAEDAVQETLIRAWQNIRKLRDPNRLEPWLHRVLVRACLYTARKVRTPSSPLGGLDWKDSRIGIEAEVAERDVVDRGMRRLSADQRSVLVLRYYLDLSVPQIADALDVPVGTAKSRLHHAQQAMRAALDADSRQVSAQGELA